PGRQVATFGRSVSSSHACSTGSCTRNWCCNAIMSGSLLLGGPVVDRAEQTTGHRRHARAVRFRRGPDLLTLLVVPEGLPRLLARLGIRELQQVDDAVRILLVDPEAGDLQAVPREERQRLVPEPPVQLVRGPWVRDVLAELVDHPTSSNARLVALRTAAATVRATSVPAPWRRYSPGACRSPLGSMAARTASAACSSRSGVGAAFVSRSSAAVARTGVAATPVSAICVRAKVPSSFTVT